MTMRHCDLYACQLCIKTNKGEQAFLLKHIFTQKKITLGLTILTLPFPPTKSPLQFKPMLFWTFTTSDNNSAFREL